MSSLANFLVERNVHRVVGSWAITAHSQETLSFLPVSVCGSLTLMATDTHGDLWETRHN